MKATLFGLVLLAGAAMALPPRWHELDSSYTYEQYLAHFGKRAPASAAERAARSAVFRSRLQEAIRHNKAGHSWKKGINHMSDWTDAERKALLGRVPRGRPLGAPERLGAVDASALRSLPTEVDWRTKGVVTPVKDQGQCGSCWAFATTEVVESHVAINTGVLAELSPQELVSCVVNTHHCGGFGGCQGATAEIGFEYIKQMGLASPYSFPYVSWAGDTNGTCAQTPARRANPVANVTGYVQLAANDAPSLLQAVATQGPIAVSVAAEPWMDYEGGVFDGCATSGSGTDIDHAVVLVGYTPDAWIIRNSWTPLWGEQGYIRLKRFPAGEPCGVDKSPQDGYECDNGPSQITVCGMCGVLSDSSYPVGAQFA